jgi:hypothetical protein
MAVALVAFAVGGGVGAIRDRISPPSEPTPVPILEQGEAPADGSPRTWTVDVAAGRMLILNASSVELVRDDDGSRIENANADGILLAAEGGHPYTLTLVGGRWAVVAEADGRQEFCNQELGQERNWGVRYMPSSWGAESC